VVLGVGINVRASAYPQDIAPRATCLEVELGRDVDRGLLLAESLAALAMRYEELQRGHGDRAVDAWRARAQGTFGRHVEWDAAGVSRHGVADNIDTTGALLVRTDAGTERLISGEVRWIS
jgi:BirA family biotin operon repressor/biotin-[acetyl-CoA-carboxylase] ligase